MSLTRPAGACCALGGACCARKHVCRGFIRPLLQHNHLHAVADTQDRDLILLGPLEEASRHARGALEVHGVRPA